MEYNQKCSVREQRGVQSEMFCERSYFGAASVVEVKAKFTRFKASVGCHSQHLSWKETKWITKFSYCSEVVGENPTGCNFVIFFHYLGRRSMSYFFDSLDFMLKGMPATRD